ncbi:hypothetical protein LTR36_002389 [Oleoguttula mirabilis]|uniref:Formin GTPase-binding domain-containing protein n=1 Tax=Oleoguttula mirabilis TaxID=1507867 RepID=A0AAV9JKN1_9PEZI|nr:hypothetical protein LTR36_002389 [Oleoguttula mirabilis]
MDESGKQMPAHRRNASSKSNLLRSLVSPKSKPASPGLDSRVSTTKSFPILPPDDLQHTKAKVLGERQGNVQSPPSSPPKSRTAPKASKDSTTSKVPPKSKDGASAPKKSKSSTNLSAMFAKMNRSSKDLSTLVHKDKENTTPPSSASGPAETPIWAQFASKDKTATRPSSRDSKSSGNIHDEIAKYTPQIYSPSKQRNFNGSLDQPSLRPTLNSRPQSAYVLGTESLVNAIGRRVSGHRASIEGRRSEDAGRRQGQEQDRRSSGDRAVLIKRTSIERKVSGSSTEQAAGKEKLTIAKRGGRVMAAVAAFQGKSKTEQPKQEAVLDPKNVDQAFEAVLESRNIPEPMRQKMRSLTLRVKADFIKQDLGSKTAGNSPTGMLNTEPSKQQSATAATDSPAALERVPTDDEDKATKRSRARSRTFTFSKGDKRNGGGTEISPTKKQRSQSKSRPTSVYIPSDSAVKSPSTATLTSPFASLGRKSAASTTTAPADYLAYLKKHQDPTKVEVGRLHKLRILLRNETVAWVDSFVSLGGMAEIVSLLHRTMAVEWREEHEDQLLHETLLCLKGLCTTERAMTELEKVADELFPALLGMLFDDEKKGPAEYTTRTIIVNVLFNFLSSMTNASPLALEQRARRILAYLGEPQKPSEETPVDFVLDMRTPRPYRLWCREMTNVTKEVFWIFLHHLNVVPMPKPTTAANVGDNSPADSVVEANDRTKVLEATYTHRHFPGSRPPVPAAPYIGGVEWDATTYLTAHLDLLNGLLASLPTRTTRNDLRTLLQASGFEKTMGTTLRTCKEKFYAGVHDGLRAWVAAAAEDGWAVRFVREGPDLVEELRARSASPRKSPKKKGAGEEAPPLEALPRLELDLGRRGGGGGGNDGNDFDDGWLG